MTQKRQTCNTPTLVALLIITLLSIAGIVTSLHLVDLHYKQPGRIDSLVARYPSVKFLKNVLPKRYLKSIVIEEPKTKEEEIKKQYDPWGGYKSDGAAKPETIAKPKETCDTNMTVGTTQVACTPVDQSKYSEIAGIGVSVYGVKGYFVMFILGLIALIQRRQRPSFFVMMIYAGSIIGFGFSIYLTYLEKYKIGAYCPYCVLSAAIMAVIFIISVAGFSKGILKSLSGKEKS